MIVVAESFLRSLVKLCGKHIVYSDGGTWYPNRSMYIDRIKTQATCVISKEHYRKNYGVCKGRTEGFDDYYPCKKLGCNLSHVYQWLVLFVFLHNLSKLVFNDSLGGGSP
jgi:putative transposase